MLEAWARDSSEGQRQESTLKLKPTGFVDGLDVVGEREKSSLLQGLGPEQLEEGVWCRKAGLGGRADFSLKCL